MKNQFSSFAKEINKSRNVYLQCETGFVYITNGYIALKLPLYFYETMLRPLSVKFIPLHDGDMASSVDGGIPEIEECSMKIKQFFNCMPKEHRVENTSLILEDIKYERKKKKTYRYRVMYSDVIGIMYINDDYFSIIGDILAHDFDNLYCYSHKSPIHNDYDNDISILVMPCKTKGSKFLVSNTLTN